LPLGGSFLFIQEDGRKRGVIKSGRGAGKISAE